MENMSTTLVSVIVPTFMRGDIAVNTVQKYHEIFMNFQRNITDFSFDLILIDDNSAEADFELLATALEPHAHLIRNKTNLGPGPSRNLGINLSRSDWIWFLDDDDSLDPTNAEIVVRELVSLRQLSSTNIICHSLRNDYNTVDSTDSLISNICLFREKQEVFNFIFRRSFLTANQITFPAQLHEDIPFIEECLLKTPINSVKCLNGIDVVNKAETSNSITANLSEARLIGLKNYLQDSKYRSRYAGSVREIEFVTQVIGVMLLLVIREKDDPAHYLDFLNSQFLNEQPPETKPYVSASSSTFAFACSTWKKNLSAPLSAQVEKLKQAFATELSCFDLEHSLFLGPNEIRACCKRFFSNGVQKGDVVICGASENLTLEAIITKKQEIKSKINAGNFSDCDDCPYLFRQPKSEIKASNISYISLENFSYCNMRCSYCSPKYYGGTEAIYDAAAIIKALDRDPLTNNEASRHIVWGGGEPTLSPKFSSINEILLTQDSTAKYRVLSNSLKHSPELTRWLRDARVQLVTSIDAGTQEIFRLIRGRGKLDQVLTNLAKYSESSIYPEQITIKYIVSEENCSSEQLGNFCTLIERYELTDHLFQISCNFKQDEPCISVIKGIYELATRLIDLKGGYVFVDDLVRDRVRLGYDLSLSVRDHLACVGLRSDHVLDHANDKKIVLWGKGSQSDWFMKESSLSQAQLIGGSVSDEHDYRKLIGDQQIDYKIFACGVQAMPEIIRNIKKAKLEQFLIRGIIL